MSIYILININVLPKGNTSAWQVVTNTTLPVSQLFIDFTECYLQVETFDGSTFYTKLSDLKSDYENYPGTITELLDLIGNRALVPVDLPNVNPGYLQYRALQKTNLRINLANINDNVPEGYPKDGFEDAKITTLSVPISIKDVFDKCLITVNGYIHSTLLDGDTLFIKSAGKALLKARSSTVGLISFADIGQIKRIPVTEDMVNPEDNLSLYEKTIISLPEPIDNKQVLLVIGGYIVWLDNGSFYTIGSTSLALQLKNLPYIERLFESRDTMDLEGLLPDDHEEPVDINLLRSDTTVKKYLTLHNSFVVIIDKPILFKNKLDVKSGGFPGQFITTYTPKYPLFGGYGKLLDYWDVFEDGFWSITVTDSYYRNFVFKTVPDSDLTVINDSLDVRLPTYIDRGFFLEIGTF